MTVDEWLDTGVMPLAECGCWIWLGGLNGAGYGRINKNQRAHRKVYEHLVGPIPKGLELDHLCRIRSCVNPAHLEPVTHGENLERGVNTAIHLERNRTHCPRGHPYEPWNLVPSVLKKGRRDCLICSRRRAKEQKERWRNG